MNKIQFSGGILIFTASVEAAAAPTVVIVDVFFFVVQSSTFVSWPIQFYLCKLCIQHTKFAIALSLSTFLFYFTFCLSPFTLLPSFTSISLTIFVLFNFITTA